MRSAFVCLCLLASLLVGGSSPAAAPLEVRSGDAYVVIDSTQARVGNGSVERVLAWDGPGFRTASLIDKRSGREWIGPDGSNDFTFSRGPVTWTSAGWTPARNSVSASTTTGGGVVFRLRLQNPAAPFTLERRVEVRPGVAGFATRTTVHAPVPVTFDAYSLDEVTLSAGGLTAHGVDMRGGADWRDNTGYDYRADVTPDADGETAEWMDVTTDGGDGLAFLMERRNYFSSSMTFDGVRASATVDTSRDLQYLGPIEPGSAGVNPTGVPRYVRTVNGSLALEPVFLGLGTDADDLPWQASKYLESRMTWERPTIDFNTNNVDKGSAGRGGGAKDDADFPTVMELLPIVERIGAEVFVLDDGWMPRSGDWWPDPDRFPEGFEPLVDELHARNMRLGLWMAPGNFHPETQTFRENPEWQCAPVGTATAVQNAFDPEGDGDLSLFGGSNEPGVGVWNLLGRGRNGVYADRLRADIDALVTRYDVAKFKYDFLVWLDCASPDPVDVYQYHDAFFERVIDPLVQAHPEVGFGVDETNDYRAFPYESIIRGPTWFQNGAPDPRVLLHNVWTLAPYVPGYTLGMHVLGGSSTARFPVDYLVAISMLYQPTLWSDVRNFVNPDGSSKLDAAGQPIIETARTWFDFFKARRHELSGFTYPLLTDPLAGDGWAAFQPWDADAQRGFVLAYRQDTDQVSVTVQLRGIEASRAFRVTDEVTGAELGVFQGAELRDGLTIGAPDRFDFRIIRVEAT
jgi:hypothetical protein